jgi:hypothetical protein
METMLHSATPTKLFTPEETAPTYLLNGMPDALLGESGRFGEEDSLSFLSVIEPRFLSRRVHHLVTITTGLSCLQFEIQF